MDQIGNREDAQRANAIVRSHRDPRRFQPRSDGWEGVGQGTTRIVWSAPTRAKGECVVYKVPCPLYPNYDWGVRHNYLEAERFQQWADRSFIPRWDLYEIRDADGALIPILAMEYLTNDGTVARNLDEVREALRSVGAEDMHPGNYRVQGGRAFLIDAAGPAGNGVPSYLPPELLGNRVAEYLASNQPRRVFGSPEPTEAEARGPFLGGRVGLLVGVALIGILVLYALSKQELPNR